MAVFVVTWNINKERTNYAAAREAFIKHLERYDNVQDSGLESVRWISSTSTAGEISSNLRQALDANDRIFVSKVATGSHQGWLAQATWDWINARL